MGRAQFRRGGVVEACPGTVLDAILFATNLTELRLVNVHIQPIELKKILESLGMRLLSFDTSICYQDESPLQRLIGLCEAAAEHTPGLQAFHQVDLGEIHFLELEGIEICTPLAHQALTTLKFLKRRAPAQSLKDVLFEIYGFPGLDGQEMAQP